MHSKYIICHTFVLFLLTSCTSKQAAATNDTLGTNPTESTRQTDAIKNEAQTSKETSSAREIISISEPIVVEDPPIIKSISEALYSPKRKGNLSRAEALKNVSSITKNNKDGYIDELIKFDSDGSIYEKTIYKRNDEGENISYLTYDNTNSMKSETAVEVIGKSTYYRTYDINALVTSVQEDQHDKNDNIYSTSRKTITSNKTWLTKRKFNIKNQMTEEIEYNPDGTEKDKRIFAYDSAGNETISILTRPNGDYTKFISSYDVHNNMIEQNWYNEDGTHKHKTSFEYTYDEHNNWTTRKRFSNDELGMVWEREIVYY